VYVVVARFYAKDGQDGEVARILRTMAGFSNAEPGCRMYIVNQAIDDPRQFVLYEQYVDEAAFEAHLASDPFKEHILGGVVPLLDQRERELYTALDPAVE